jgi:uncharacterized protein YndB with AHSA1/START domain
LPGAGGLVRRHGRRSISLDVEIGASPREVWEAVATGPGLGRWHVRAGVDGRPNGAITLELPHGPENARITAWDPPRRFAYVGPEASGPLTHEMVVVGQDDGTSLAALTIDGFLPSDGDVARTAAEWRRRLDALAIALEHFPAQDRETIDPVGTAPGPLGAAWGTFADALGLPRDAGAGRWVSASADAPPFAGTVVRRAGPWMTVLVDEPGPGLAFVGVIQGRGSFHPTVELHLYGPGAPRLARDHRAAWHTWMAERFPPDRPADRTVSPD